MLRRLSVALAPTLALVACASTTDTSSEVPGPMTDTLTVTSAAFTDGGAIPSKHTCDGEDLSPSLAWTGAPEGTAAFALIVDDPDARGWVHWVVADIPADTAELPEGGGAGAEGRNDFGRTGWGGPCPPSGTHRYDFTVFALSEQTGLSTGFSADALRAAMEGKVLAEGRLSATYRRGG
jgi:Raf kinase inhibitor-like YbhB/YbcL family protein